MTQNQEALAIKLKQAGNVFFKAKQYQAAIGKYDEALTLCPTISVLRSNKARCYRELCNNQACLAEAEKAVQLDQKNIKAYFLIGESLVSIADQSKDVEKVKQAIEQLKKSLRLCPGQGKGQFEERFVHEILKAKKKLWLLEADSNQGKKKALRSYLVGLVEGDDKLSEEEKDALQGNIAAVIDKKFGCKQPIPQALICPLSKVMFKDPICNQFGNSYSRVVYQKELKDKGNKDPLSDKPLLSLVTYPNVNLRKAVQKFIDKNPWAYEQMHSDNILYQ